MHADDARRDAEGSVLRAQELRATLTARRDVESLLAQASAERQAAVVDADAMLAEAEQVSAQLVAESRREAERHAARAQAGAEQVLAQARADAEVIRARAEAEVEEHRRRARAEIAEQVGRDVRDRATAELTAVREQSAAMIGDLEASVRILGVALQSAQTTVGELLAALGEGRLHTAETAPAPAPEAEPAVVADTEPDPEPEPDPVAAPDAGFDPAGDPDDAPPRTALEAYLRSAHLDHGDPPLPPIDDTEVGVRYVRDAEAQAGRTDGRSDGRTDGRADGRTDGRADGAAPRSDKPLGWLFRSAP